MATEFESYLDEWQHARYRVRTQRDGLEWVNKMNTPLCETCHCYTVDVLIANHAAFVCHRCRLLWVSAATPRNRHNPPSVVSTWRRLGDPVQLVALLSPALAPIRTHKDDVYCSVCKATGGRMAWVNGTWAHVECAEGKAA